MTPTCETCRFWVRVRMVHGHCHRFPPTPFAGAAAFYPSTVTQDWCGEWQLSVEEERASYAVLMAGEMKAMGASKEQINKALK